jgi:hypothetical protein
MFCNSFIFYSEVYSPISNPKFEGHTLAMRDYICNEFAATYRIERVLTMAYDRIIGVLDFVHHL